MKSKKGAIIIWILIVLILIALGIAIYFLLSGGSSIPQPPALPE